MLAKEQNKTVEDIRAFTSESMGEFDEFGDLHALPEKGWKDSELLPRMLKLRGAEKDYQAGKAFGGIYYDDKQLKQAINQAYCHFADSNGLFPGIFPGLRKMELDIVRMARALMHGGKSVQGLLTTGGSESILLALKAYKEQGLKRGIDEPEALIPLSAHPAFAKACNYFGIKFVGCQVGADGRVSLSDVRSKITRNTVLIVASSPNFASGTIDPVEDLAKLAVANKIGLHVDACLGGFLLPFLEQLGHSSQKFDFRVKGVTSISTDIHKYGFGPKGSSVILFETDKLREDAFFSWTEWTGGMYCSPSMTGSRAGGIIAAAWATLMLLGRDGYLRIAEECWVSFDTLVKGIRNSRGFQLLGEPHACCVGFRCTEGPPTRIYQVAAALKKNYGWSVNYFQNPIACGVQIGSRRGFDSEQFCKDLQASLQLVEQHPEDYSGGLTQIYGMAANLGDRQVVGDLLKSYLTELYRAN